MKVRRIPIFIPQLGCSHACSYCNQIEITGVEKAPPPSFVDIIVNEHLSTFAPDTEAEIAFFGGTFTALSPALQELYLKQAHKYIHPDSPIKGIRFSTRPDDIHPEMIPLYKQYGVNTIELGAQSLQDDILLSIKRGHTRADVEKASAIIKNAGLRLGLQMMIGLPGDSIDKSLDTAASIIRFAADETRIYPTLVIEHTLLAHQYREGLYAPLSLQQAVDWCAQLIPVFENANVIILRVGLHPSEGLVNHDSYVAGPFHPAFRSLAESLIWNKIWEKFCSKQQVSNCFKSKKEIQIRVNHKQVNSAYGHNGENATLLRNFFWKVKIYPDENISGRNFEYVFS